MSELARGAAEPITDSPSLEGKLLLLYDGVCGLCNRTVQFALKRDRADRFRFAPLQGDLAHKILRRHGFDPEELDTVYLVEGAGTSSERLVRKSRAILGTLRGLGGFWGVLSLARVLPRRFTDGCYEFVARRRYRWFGKYDACPVPTKEQRRKFVGMEEPDERGQLPS